MVNVLCHITARKLRKKHKVVSLKYEDLIKMPEQILAEIQRELKVDLTESIRRIENDEYLEVGELFEGNSIRINERVKFRREDIIYPRNLKNGVTRALNFLIYIDKERLIRPNRFSKPVRSKIKAEKQICQKPLTYKLESQ